MGRECRRGGKVRPVRKQHQLKFIARSRSNRCHRCQEPLGFGINMDADADFIHNRLCRHGFPFDPLLRWLTINAKPR